MDFILQRLKEPTSWLALIGIATGFGLNIAPELAEIIQTVGVGVACMVAFFMKEGAAKDVKK